MISRTNDFVTRPLLAGAEETLRRHGVPPEAVDVVWTPGAFELGATAIHLARTRDVAAIACLGAVIRGETAHYDHICRVSADGVAAAARTTGIPVTFGVVTAETAELALARAGGDHGNLGAKAVEAALEMADCYAALAAGAPPRAAGPASR